MFPDYNKEIQLKSKSLTVPEVISLLDQIESELSKDQITEQFVPFVNFVSEQLREMRRLAIQVAEEADEDKMSFPKVKGLLPN